MKTENNNNIEEINLNDIIVNELLYPFLRLVFDFISWVWSGLTVVFGIGLVLGYYCLLFFIFIMMFKLLV